MKTVKMPIYTFEAERAKYGTRTFGWTPRAYKNGKLIYKHTFVMPLKSQAECIAKADILADIQETLAI